jgi:hypothetical protein
MAEEQHVEHTHSISPGSGETNEQKKQHSSTGEQELGERFSLRAEVVALVDHWLADAGGDEQECKMLRYVKEDVLAALDDSTRGTR